MEAVQDTPAGRDLASSYYDPKLLNSVTISKLRLTSFFVAWTSIQLDWKASCDSLAKISLHPHLPGHPMNNIYKLLERLHVGSRKNRRLHPRETCLIDTGYMVRNHWYRGRIKDISAGGAYVEAMESRIFSPREEILLVAKIRVLREQLRGRIAWVGLHGMGVKFQFPELDAGES